MAAPTVAGRGVGTGGEVEPARLGAHEGAVSEPAPDLQAAVDRLGRLSEEEYATTHTVLRRCR